MGGGVPLRPGFPGVGTAAEGSEEGVAEGGLGQSLLCLQEELRAKGAPTPWKAGRPKAPLVGRMRLDRPAVKFRGPAGSFSSRQRRRWAVLGRPCEGDHSYLLRL